MMIKGGRIKSQRLSQRLGGGTLGGERLASLTLGGRTPASLTLRGKARSLSLTGFLTAGMLAALMALAAMAALPRPSLAADECGTGADATAGTTRFDLYAARANYARGGIVRHTVEGTERLYRAEGAITGSPGGDDGTTAANGWSANLGDDDYAANEIICVDSQDAMSTPPYGAVIDYDDNDLAIIYRRTDEATSIAHTGEGGEIHVLSGSLSGSTGNVGGGGVLDIDAGGTGDLRIVVASGVSISNTVNTAGQYGVSIQKSGGASGSLYLDIAGDVSAMGGTGASAVFGVIESGAGDGDIFITVSGDTSGAASGTQTDAATGATVRALTREAGEAHIDITGGTHINSGGAAVVSAVSGGGGQATVDVSSGAILRATATSRRIGIDLASSNTETETARTIGMGTWMGNRASNAGTVIGDFSSGAGNDLFENSGSFIGSIGTGAGNDEVRNAGTMRLIRNVDMGAGTDSVINEGTLIIDHAAVIAATAEWSGTATYAGGNIFRVGSTVFQVSSTISGPDLTALNNLSTSPPTSSTAGIAVTHLDIALSGVETFTQTSGTIRFVYDFDEPARAVSAANALFDLGGAATATFTAGVIELAIVPGSLYRGGIDLPLITRTSAGGLTAEQVAALSSPDGTLSLTSGGVLQITLHDTICGAPSANRVVCDSAVPNFYNGGITASAANLAVIYDTTASQTPFIRHRGSGGEIHLRSGNIIKPADSPDGIALSLRPPASATAPGLYLTTAAGTTVSNLDTSQSQHGIDIALATSLSDSHIRANIAGDVSTVGEFGRGVNLLVQGSTGGVFLTVSGDVSTTGDRSAAIDAQTRGGGVHVDITGGTQSASGMQDVNFAVVNLVTPSAQITVDISSGAVVQAIGSATRSLRLTSGDTATSTARTIGSGSFSGNRASNSGTIIGDFDGRGSGNYLFENSGTFTGAITMADGDDTVRNSGILRITDDIDFGAGTDSLVNQGTLVIDHAAKGGRIAVADLETFRQTSGVIRFVFNFNNAAPSITRGNALLSFGGTPTTPALTFTAGAIEVAPSVGSTFTGGAVLPLMSRGSGDLATASQISALTSALTSPHGTLSLESGILQITLFDSVCGAISARAVSAGANRQITCALTADNVYAGGIGTNADNLAIFYNSPASGTAFVRNLGAGGEVYIQQGAIAKPNNADNNPAVSIARTRLGRVAEWSADATYFRTNQFRIGSAVYTVDISSTTGERTLLNELTAIPDPFEPATYGLTNIGTYDTSAIVINVASGATIRNLDTDAPGLDQAALLRGQLINLRHNAIYAQGDGPLSMNIAGTVSAAAPNTAAIDAIVSGNAEVDISGDVTTTLADSLANSPALAIDGDAVNVQLAAGAELSASGGFSNRAVVSLTGTHILLNIASGATINAAFTEISDQRRALYGERKRAILLTSSNADTSTPRQIGSGMWDGNRVSNAGAVIGDFISAGVSNDLFENLAGARFSGRIDTGGGDDEIRNEGAMTILAGNFGSGADALINQGAGTLIVDYVSSIAHQRARIDAIVFQRLAFDYATTYALNDRFSIGDAVYQITGTPTEITALNNLIGARPGATPPTPADPLPTADTPGLTDITASTFPAAPREAIHPTIRENAEDWDFDTAYVSGNKFYVGNFVYQITGSAAEIAALNALPDTGPEPGINTPGITILGGAPSDVVTLHGLESFVISGGTLRFRLNSDNFPRAPIFHLPVATVSFTGGAVEVVDEDGNSPAVIGNTPLLSVGGGLTEDQIADLSSPQGDLAIVDGNLVLNLSVMCGNRVAAREPVLPGAATSQILCETPQGGGIIIRRDSIALLYAATEAGTPSITHQGQGGEIHIGAGAGAIVKPANSRSGPAVSVITTGTDPILITTGAGSSIVNQNPAGSASNAAIIADGGGNIFMTLAGSASSLAEQAVIAATGPSGSAGEVHVDITGGTYQASGAQEVLQGVVGIGTFGGQATLDVAQGAAIRSFGDATLAVGISAINTATDTPRTIGTGMWQGNRFTNAGTIIGDFESEAGNDLIENAASGVFTGTFLTSGGDDEIQNEGTINIDSTPDFGAGTDAFVNRGTLFFDTIASGGRQIELVGLESFTQTSGVIGFRLDVQNIPSDPLLNLGSITTILTEASVEIAGIGGGDFSSVGTEVIPLITAATPLTEQQISGLTSTFGTLSLTSDGVLQIALFELNIICGAAPAAREPVAPGVADRQASCGSEQASSYLAGISVRANRVALLYDNPLPGTPFIRHTGDGGEAHIARGSIFKTDRQSDGAALSVLDRRFSASQWSARAEYAVGDQFIANNILFRVNPSASRTQLAALNAETSAPAATSTTLGITQIATVNPANTDPIYITTAAGTSVTNADSDLNANNAAIRAAGFGDITMNIAGSTSSAAETAIDVRTRGTGNINVNIIGGTHSAAGVPNLLGISTVLLYPTGGNAVLNIGPAATIQATVHRRNAISLFTPAIPAGSTPRTIGAGLWLGGRVTNAGTVTGNFIGGAGYELFENTPTARFTGTFSMGAGTDEVRNAGAMILDGGSDFGAGTDAFVNLGTLVIDHAANQNQQINMAGLESFTQAGGTLRFVFDFGNPLPTGSAGALFHVGNRLIFTAGQIEIAAAGGSAAPLTGTLPLIAAGNLPAGLPASVVASELGTISVNSQTGVVQLELTSPDRASVLQSYNAFLQTLWHADRALARAMNTRSCPEDGSRFCTWSNASGRVTRHDPDNGARFDEDAYSLTVGFHLYRPLWRVSGTIAYEDGSMDLQVPGEQKASADANRFLAALLLATRNEPLFASFHGDLQLRVAYATYETSRTDSRIGTPHTSDPEVSQFSFAAGVEQRGYLKNALARDSWAENLFGSFFLVSRMEVGMFAQRMDAFSETGDLALTVEEFNHILGFAKTYLEVSSVNDTQLGAFTSWARLGGEVFIGDPEADMRASLSGRATVAKGTMPRAMFDFGAGIGYRLLKSMDLNLRYEGALSFEGETDIHRATVRLNVAF